MEFYDFMESIPVEFRDEFREILSSIDDNRENPMKFLKTVHDFFRRLCQETGVDFGVFMDTVYGDGN